MRKLLWIAILVVCTLRCSAWAFEYSYLNYFDPQADDHIEGETNFFQFGSVNTRSGWVTDGLYGTLVQHFEFPTAMSEAGWTHESYIKINEVLAGKIRQVL